MRIATSDLRAKAIANGQLPLGSDTSHAAMMLGSEGEQQSRAQNA